MGLIGHLLNQKYEITVRKSKVKGQKYKLIPIRYALTGLEEKVLEVKNN